MVALLGMLRNRKISLEVLNLAMIDQRIMKSSRCISSSSSPATPKFSYVLENDNKLLKKLDHKDWLAPNEVLKIFKSLRDPESVITVFEKLSHRKDYKPNEPLYSVMIEKLAHARKFDAIEGLFARIKTENCRLSDEFFYRIIKIYGNVVNNPEQAIKILFRMPDYRCWPSVKTFNFVLNMLVCAKQFDVIHEVYLGAPRLGVTIDACCFNILIKALCELDKLDAAFALLHEFPKQNCRPNTKTYSTLMHGLCKNDRVNEAFELFDRMEKEDCYPDTITFNILISGLCKQGRVDEAMNLLHQMKLKGCSPNSGSYQAVLYGLLGCEKFVEAKDFMDRMHSEGIFPSFLSYKMLIEGLCNLNLLNSVDLVLKQMVHQGFVPRMGTWKKILGSMSLRNDSCIHIAY
ncbi:pentatricopeptide repeat-containing protein, mitochondrial-like protein [Cinnamomum micranthum f. kanehirae]|uniref:Pentatricopeptide repeat-containing protein, mitochondrial-like protein n=1 Tax=Cinnamomum micranthum f. kanehirae TaxID=337451 RepID=A0A443PZH2_9MAGN|nr:pentatricopeptide repeat-containing protein, mitochondrial-like protein [Cinnamomum micranthum f. kanehirae]